MDALSDILKTVRVKGSVYHCDHLHTPWSVEKSNTSSASFHLVRRGECWVSARGETERLGPGDLVFLEPGVDHRLVGQPPEQPAGTELKGQTLLLCGSCEYQQDIDTPLFSAMDPVMIIREEEFLKNPWLKATLDQISSEYLEQKPGAQLVVNKLTEVVLVEMIRINFGRSKSNPFISALSHPQISKALQILHSSPATSWTLDKISDAIGMSRASFARQFKNLTGKTMFEYLTSLRMQHAADLLLESKRAVFEVANKVGYDSDLAFTKTFKKRTGMTPTQYRKNHRS